MNLPPNFNRGLPRIQEKIYYSLPGGYLRESVTVLAQQTHSRQTLTKENNLQVPDKPFKPCHRHSSLAVWSPVLKVHCLAIRIFQEMQIYAHSFILLDPGKFETFHCFRPSHRPVVYSSVLYT